MAGTTGAADTGIVRLGPIFTAFLAAMTSLSFFVHERPLPPTVGHAAAGIAIAVPILFLIWAMTQPGESRDAAFRLLVLQVIATGVAMTAFAFLRANSPPMATLLPLALFLLPLIATTVWIVRPRPSAPAPSGLQLRMKEIRALPLPAQLALVFFSLATVLVIYGAAAITTLRCVGGAGGPGGLPCVQSAWNLGYTAFAIIVVLTLCGGVALFRLMPADVRATFKEARAHAKAHPDDAPAIAAELRQRVPAAYRPRLVREIYLRAGLQRGMSTFEAIRYATAAAREDTSAGGHPQSIAS